LSKTLRYGLLQYFNVEATFLNLSSQFQVVFPSCMLKQHEVRLGNLPPSCTSGSRKLSISLFRILTW